MPILVGDAEPVAMYEIPPAPEPPRSVERRSRFRINPLLYLAGLVVVLPLLILVGTLVVHRLRVEPRDGFALAAAELSQLELEPGERILRQTQVWRRTVPEYFRATRGIVALTDRRLLYVGLLPRDVYAEAREPDAFDRRASPIDTTVSVAAGRTHLFTRRAIILARDGEEPLRLAVAGPAWRDAGAIIAQVTRRQAEQRAEAERIRRERLAAEEAARRPIWHEVARGEALSTIATRYNTTVDRLRELNGLPDTRIRAGQRLLVKPQE